MSLLATEVWHAGRWYRYKKYAWGRDELLPLQKSAKDSFAGMAATLLDSLSTLWLMGLKDEFALGRDWVAANLDFAAIHVVRAVLCADRKRAAAAAAVSAQPR